MQTHLLMQACYVNDASFQTSGVSGLQMFFRWIRTFVAHFLGKRNLEFYSAQLASVGLNKRPEIRVFAVNSGRYRMPAWEEFKKVIENALVDTSEEDKVKIIQTLSEAVVNGTGLTPEARQSVKFLRDIIMGRQKDTCDLLMHCEAVVAALLQFRQSPSTDLTFKDHKILADLSEVLGLVLE